MSTWLKGRQGKLTMVCLYDGGEVVMVMEKESV